MTPRPSLDPSHPARRIALVGALTLVMSLAVFVPVAGASSASVSVTSSGFSPKTVTVAVGGTVTWTFNGPSGQGVASSPDVGIGLASGPEPTGGQYTFAFNQAGLYAYNDPMTGKSGTVKVTFSVSPTSGTTATSFAIGWGAAAPPSGDAESIELSYCAPAPAVCTTDFASLDGGAVASPTMFTPQFGPGTYSFRVQLIDGNNGNLTGFASTKSIAVTSPTAGIRGVSPTFALAGAPVTISGWMFTGATDVQFGGVSVGSGNFTVVNDSTITASVPAGAVTGPVTVVTSAGTAVSPSNFTVGARPQHIVVIWMENRSSSIIGTPDAPYLTSLAQQYTNFTNFYSAQHGSLADYLEMTSGIPPSCGAGQNKTPPQCVDTYPSLFAQLLGAGISWKAYVEEYPKPGTCDLTDGKVVDYVPYHVPALYYTDTNTNPTQCANIVGLDQLSTDLTSNNLPDISFITPSELNNMASGGVSHVTLGDNFLQAWVPQLIADGAEVVITWDEGAAADLGACCSFSHGGNTPMVIAGQGVPQQTITANFTTYSILAAIEGAYGLPPLVRAGNIVNVPVPL